MPTVATPQTGAPRRVRPARRRPKVWQELLLLAGLYLAYSLSRALVGEDDGAARAAATHLLHLERAFGLDVELSLARWLAASTALSVVAGYLYALLHYTVTPAVLVWMYRRRPLQYTSARTVLLVSTFVALACYWLLPVAPPRLLSPSYPDVLAMTSQWGWWGAEASAPRGLGGLTNQYAALPSMHVGWAVWCGLVVFTNARSRLVRAAAVAYPLLITVVVVATSNHYLLDAVAGAVLVLLAAVAVRRLSRPVRLVPEQRRSGSALAA